MKKFEFTNLYFVQHYYDIIELLKTFNQDIIIFNYKGEVLISSELTIEQLSLGVMLELSSTNDFPEIYCLVEDQHALQFKLSLP